MRESDNTEKASSSRRKMLSLIGGKLEAGGGAADVLRDTVRRELLEEVGVEVGELAFVTSTCAGPTTVNSHDSHATRLAVFAPKFRCSTTVFWPLVSLVSIASSLQGSAWFGAQTPGHFPVTLPRFSFGYAGSQDIVYYYIVVIYLYYESVVRDKRESRTSR